ncbi:unnamed protein product [Chrysoparadoxa australica]
MKVPGPPPLGSATEAASSVGAVAGPPPSSSVSTEGLELLCSSAQHQLTTTNPLSQRQEALSPPTRPLYVHSATATDAAVPVPRPPEFIGPHRVVSQRSASASSKRNQTPLIYASPSPNPNPNRIAAAMLKSPLVQYTAEAARQQQPRQPHKTRQGGG